MILAPRIGSGDHLRVIAPSRSLSLPFITPILPKAEKRIRELGIKFSYGKYVKESDEFGSTTAEHRVEDLHDAFSDKKVKLILSIIGGFNSNQMLRYIDFDIIKSNPKVFCGYSDITALQNAIFAKTGLVTYSGPHMFTFGWEEDNKYTLDYFKKCLFSNKPYSIVPSKAVAEWASKEHKRISYKNSGHWILQKGNANGTIVGANLCTFNLLQGTEFMPKLDGSLLFIEDDAAANPSLLDRDLQSLLHQPGADGITGLVMGRFQKESGIERKTLQRIISAKRELKGLPVLANVDFGHTYPMITFPIGGTASMDLDGKVSRLDIIKH